MPASLVHQLASCLHHVDELLLLCYLAAIYRLSVAISQLSSGYPSAISRLPLPAVGPLAKELTLWPAFALKDGLK